MPRWCLVLMALATAVPRASAQCRFSAATHDYVLTYTFASTVTSEATTLHVTLTFPGGAQGTEAIAYPTEWAGESLHGVTNLRALSADTILSDGATPDSRTVRYPANQEVMLAYDLVKDWAGPFQQPLQFHPVLLPEYVEITGDNALVHPVLDSFAPVTVNFDWQHLSPSWALATSFATSAGPGDRCQSFSGTWDAVQHALFAAGDFRIHRFVIGRRPVVLAIRGRWSFTDDEVITYLQTVIGIVRAFWRDDEFPYFLVTWKPYDTESGSGDGSAFTNAFWIDMSRRDPLSGQLTQLSHESFHAWNTSRMGEVADDPSSRLEWFKEGVTRYYADVLVHRAGLMPLPTYLDNTNRDLRDAQTSTSAYVRGRILALWLDGQIRAESNQTRSLDDAMHDLVEGAHRPLTQTRILETLGGFLSADAQRQLSRTVEEGAALPVPGDGALGPCAHLTTDVVPTFDLGFDFASSRAAQAVVGVRRDGPAFAAGLRDGQRLTGWSVLDNQPDHAAKLTIQTAPASRRCSSIHEASP